MVEKVSDFIEIRVLFWPEISALGVFFKFLITSVCAPLITQVLPPLGTPPVINSYNIPWLPPQQQNIIKLHSYIILGPVITERSLNKNALNTHFDFPTFLAKYVRFHLMISHLLLGLKTTNFIHLERRSFKIY